MKWLCVGLFLLATQKNIAQQPVSICGKSGEQVNIAALLECDSLTCSLGGMIIQFNCCVFFRDDTDSLDHIQCIPQERNLISNQIKDYLRYKNKSVRKVVFEEIMVKPEVGKPYFLKEEYIFTHH